MRKQPQTSTDLITLRLGELSDPITLILGELSDLITSNNTNLHNPKYGPSRYIITCTLVQEESGELVAR